MPVIAAFSSVLLHKNDKEFADYLDLLAISTSLILIFFSAVFMIIQYHNRK